MPSDDTTWSSSPARADLKCGHDSYATPQSAGVDSGIGHSAAEGEPVWGEVLRDVADGQEVRPHVVAPPLVPDRGKPRHNVGHALGTHS